FLASLLASEGGSTAVAATTRLADSEARQTRVAVAVTFSDQGESIGLVELLFHDPVSDDGRRGVERLLAITSDLFGTYFQQERLRRLGTATDRWRQFELLVGRVHASLNLDETASQLVNDGRVFVECDRVSLMVYRAGRLQTVAVSGVDSFERRSQLVRNMEALGEVVARSKRWLRYQGDTHELPPQVQEVVCDYADVSHAQTIDVVPLVASSLLDVDGVALEPEDPSPVGVLLFERFDSPPDGQTEQRISQLTNLGSIAVRNAIDYSTLPFLSFSKATRLATQAGWLRAKRVWWITLFSLLTVTTIGMIPVRFSVGARGLLQPCVRRDVFAPMDVEVMEVACDHDALVKKDDVLLRLRSRQLELDLQRVKGESQTTRKRLLAVTSARVQEDSDPADQYRGRFAAEEQELREVLASLKKQLALLRDQRDRLVVRSPIEGRVLTWAPTELLADRPVARGQLLISLADTGGDWELEVQVPDREIGWIKEAKLGEQPLEVRFALAAGGEQIFKGKVHSIAGRTEIDQDGEAVVTVRVSVNDSRAASFRSGETVFADVDCGRRSIAFVVFHRVIDSAWRWLTL
ncbi:MAG: HlyD family efflux transporter periplasmic adaptor subunit, partial [Planctomycetota bacterium]